MEPFGPRREELRAGILAATVVNSNPWGDEDREPCYAADIFPTLQIDEPELTEEEDAEEQRKILRMYAAR